MMQFLVDSHCHLASLNTQKTGFSIDDYINRAKSVGVSHLLSIACTVDDYQDMIRLIDNKKGIYTSCGIHPLNIDECPSFPEDSLKNIIQTDQCIAIGETGLDYYYSEDSKSIQKDYFQRHIHLALEYKKPLIVHARLAHFDTVDILKENKAYDIGGIMHCYCDGIEMAKKCLDMGFYISFSGICTFKGADNVRDVIKYVPDDRLLVETDCPYLAPVPVRGIDNEPAFVRYTLDFIALFKGIKASTLAQITSDNFSRLFNLTLSEENSIQANSTEVNNYKIEKIMCPIA